MRVLVVLIGSDMDPHCWIHNSFRRHVCQDLEGARNLQKCEDEEEGTEECYVLHNKYVYVIIISISTYFQELN